MKMILKCFLLLLFLRLNLCDRVTNGTELLFTFLVLRHGDRTPINNRLFILPENVPVLEDLVEPYGYGELTHVGLNRSYALGRFIRYRYDKLLTPRYKHSQIYIRSTDVDRVKMTTLAMMAAVYPPANQTWTNNWTPVPYTTVPVEYDYNMPFDNCPSLMKSNRKILYSKPPEMEEYNELLNKLAQLGHNITEYPIYLLIMHDVYQSQIGLGVPIKQQILDLLPEIYRAANKSAELSLGYEENISLLSGVLLNEFFEASAKVIAERPTEKVRIYSSHEVNVYGFELATRVVPRQGPVKFCALMGLELRKITETGRFVVVPIYLPSPGEELKYLQIEGCSGPLCEYDEFKELTSRYALNESEWRNQCKLKE